MLILKNARVLTMAGSPLSRGDIAIENGRIFAVEQEIDPGPGDETLDISGLTAMPGIIDAHCHIGMWEDGMDFEGADGNEESDPITPHLRAIDAINPFDRCFEEAAAAGVTTAVTGPGSANVIGGQFAAIKTAGGVTIEDRLLKAPAALKAAFGENPKHVYHDKDHSPMTRMATAALLREALLSARQYGLMRNKNDEGPDLKKDALLDVLQRRVPLKCHAHRADDILTAIRIAKEFNIDYTIDHCTEGALIADILKKENAKIILGPLISERCKIELKNMDIHTPALLEKAGLEFAIATDHPVVPIQYLPVTAAIAVREGLSEETALKAITITAAKICGLSSRVGSLEKGKDADVAIYDGDPLDVRSRCVLTLINGRAAYGAKRAL